MQTFRYGMVWRAMGGFPIFLAIAIPILMVLNNEKFDRDFFVWLIAFAAAGIWSCLYFTKYAVTLGADGFTVERFARRPLVIAWREVHSARAKDGELTLRTIDNRRIKFNSYFPGYAALESAAVANLPAVAFGPPSLPARVKPERDSLELFRQNLLIACGLTALYLALGFARAHIDFRHLSPWTAGTILSIIAQAKWASFAGAVISAVFAVLFFIFHLRDVDRIKGGTIYRGGR